MSELREAAIGLQYDGDGRVISVVTAPAEEDFSAWPSTVKAGGYVDLIAGPELFYVSGGEVLPRQLLSPEATIQDTSKYLEETVLLENVPGGAQVKVTCLSSDYLTDIEVAGYLTEFTADGTPIELGVEFPGLYRITVDPFPFLKQVFDVEFLLQ